uniref:BRCA2 DNA repair associated n=1 Tax=Monopterus albus TaxID=43700 RepID=A0A3Q3K1N5_MONAL
RFADFFSLGPLDPDWFDVLTAQSFTNEGSVSDQDDLCANQEGMFKTPFDKTASDSQLFSTPRVFRHNRVVSPQTDDEQSFTIEQALPWIATQSPCWFRMSKDSYAKHICESLGAQIHPDVSWTSSLNTPPAVSNTIPYIGVLGYDFKLLVQLICFSYIFQFVRKLFPSLSNASRVGAHKDNDMPTLNQGTKGFFVCFLQFDNSSLNESDGVCRQKHPDAIEDGEIQSTVPSVLVGAENVLPKLLTNSSSALRKVKTDRIKRKQIILTKEDGCSSVQTSITSNAVSSEQITDAQEPVKHSSTPPVKTGDIEMTQWSPLNFSEISPYTVDISCHDRSPATQVENSTVIEQLQSYSDSGQQVRPPLTITGSGFTKKKRKFVYTVETSKTQVQEKEIQSEKTDSSPDNAPLTVEAKVLDLDMSQLCRDFAQDFSQMPDSSKLSKVAEDTPQIGFSPSACLSAMKRARQKARPANLDQDCDGVDNRRHVSTNNQNYSLNEGTVSDSGFQSGVADITHLTTTSSVLPSLENSGQSQQWSGFETDIHRSYSFLSSNKGNGKAHLEILQETNAKLPCAVKENQTLDPGGVGELHIESTSTQLPNRTKGTADSISYIPLGGQEATTSLSSVHVSGFKTASNKDIGISLASLDRAKCLFEEDETKWTFHHQPTKTAHDTNVKISVGHGSVKNANGDTSCQLTASQKADVTELCTLLEEADSQFEFTQFKSAKLKQHCQDNATTFQSFDKELDPDLLTGIDFDDSFSSDTEKHLTTTTTTTTAVMPDKANSGYNATSKQDNKNPLVLDVGFKTAGGNVLKVSKKCLSRARALFADFENLTDQRSPDEQGIEMNAKVTQGQVKGIRDTDATQVDTIACQCGLGMASGKEISVSAKAIQEADAFVKDCSVMNSNTDMSASHKKCIEPLPGSVTHKKYLPKFKNVQETFSEEPISEFQNVNAGPAACHSSVQCNVETLSFAFKNTQAITNAVSFYENPSTTVKCSSPSWTSSKNIDFSAVNESSSGGGFYTASGKKVSVSADAMKKAECLLSEIHRFEDTNKQLKQKGDALSTGNLINQVQVVTPKNGGFQTASGKGVVISSAALKKAESLLSECDAVEDKTGVKQPYSKLLVPGPSPRNSGFLAASGKPMALSAEALQKAKALFSDISFSAKIPAVSDTRNCDKKLENAGKMDKVHCGFMTAGGAAVHVSQKNLLKAKNLLKEFDDGSNRPQRRRRTISHQDIASLQDGEELYEAVGDDPTYFEVIRNLHYSFLT